MKAESRRCPHLQRCELYPLFALRASLKTWQIRYCEGDFSVCHRFRRAEHGVAIPSNLLPNGKLLPLAGKKGTAEE